MYWDQKKKIEPTKNRFDLAKDLEDDNDDNHFREERKKIQIYSMGTKILVSGFLLSSPTSFFYVLFKSLITNNEVSYRSSPSSTQLIFF